MATAEEVYRSPEFRALVEAYMTAPEAAPFDEGAPTLTQEQAERIAALLNSSH